MADFHTRLIQEIKATKNPVAPRGTHYRQVVDQVNRLTTEVFPPRGASDRTLAALDEDYIEDTDAATEAAIEAEDAGALTVTETWKEIQANYVEVEIDGATIRRRTSSLFSTPNGNIRMTFLDISGA